MAVRPHQHRTVVAGSAHSRPVPFGIAVSALADKHDAQRNAGLRGSLVADTPPFTLVARHEQREPAAPDEIERRDATFRAFEPGVRQTVRSEEHTSELQSLMRISSAVFCLKK